MMRKVSRLVAAGVVGTTLFIAAPIVTSPAGAQEEPCIITGASGPISGPIYRLGVQIGGILAGPIKGLGCAFDTLGA